MKCLNGLDLIISTAAAACAKNTTIVPLAVYYIGTKWTSLSIYPRLERQVDRNSVNAVPLFFQKRRGGKKTATKWLLN